jgi:hypothetical protein
MSRVTAEPEFTLVPALGLSLITSPDGTEELLTVVIVPTTSPAPVIAVVAAAWVSPTTLGTETCAAPVEMTRLTAEPEFTLVPAPGLSLITSPDGTVGLVVIVTVPTTSPAPVMAVVAAAWVSPTTLGTATCAAAVTVNVTVVICVTLPPVPVTLMGYMPVTVVGATVRVRVEVPEPGAAIDVGLKPAVTPVGWPVADKATAELKPPETVVVIVDVPLAPCTTETEVGAAEMVKLGTANPASALTRALPLGLPQPVDKS